MAGALRASWALPPGPAPNVVELLESHGVAVIRLPLGSVDVDAFSLPLSDDGVVGEGQRQERPGPLPVRRGARTWAPGHARRSNLGLTRDRNRHTPSPPRS